MALRARTLTILGFFFAALSASTATPSESKCPQGNELRVQALKTEGWFGDLHWMSLAIPERKDSRDSYCYERTIIVARPTQINWPIAGMSNLYVKSYFTTSRCCEGGARTEEGPLEFGAFPRKIRTQVYCGMTERLSELFTNPIVPKLYVSPTFEAATERYISRQRFNKEILAFLSTTRKSDWRWTTMSGELMTPAMSAEVNLILRRNPNGTIRVINAGNTDQHVTFGNQSNNQFFILASASGIDISGAITDIQFKATSAASGEPSVLSFTIPRNN